MSNTQSIDSLRELNVKLLAEITELRKKFAEIESENAEIPELRRKVADVEAENAKLRQIIEENAKRDVRVKELEQKNTELEARLAIVEQSSVAVNGQSQNDKEAIPEVTISTVDVSVVDQLKQHVPVCKANDVVSEVLSEINSKSQRWINS